VIYVSAARNLLAGDGISIPVAGEDPEPVTHFPPLFIVAAAAPGLLGADPLDSVRWTNVLLFAINVLLIGWIVRAVANSAAWGAFFATLALASYELIRVHAFAWSEPLFLALTYAGLYLLATSGGRDRRRFAAAAGLLALAFLARYVGVVALGTGALHLATDLRRSRSERVRDVVLFLAIGAIPAIAWSLRNLIVGGSAVDRALAFHPIDPRKLLHAGWVLGSWIVPGLVAVGVVAWIGSPSGTRRIASPLGDRTVRLFGAYGLLYVVFVFLSMTFIDAHTPANHRIFIPVYPAALVVFAAWLRGLAPPPGRSRRVAIALAVLALGIGLPRLATAGLWTARSFAGGHGFASREWAHSETIQRVRELEAGTPIHSNAADAILILTGRVASTVPRRFDAITRLPDDGYGDGVDRLDADLRRGAVVVWFDRVDWRWYLPPERVLVDALALRPIHELADGRIHAREP
jgi:hypothetical protein